MNPLSRLRPNHRARSLVLVALLPLQAVAAEAATVPGVSFGTMMQTFAGLLFILALFIGAAWLARRLGVGNALAAGKGPMKVVGGLAISPREKILLVEIEETWLVVGVSPGQMRTLHTLPKGTLPAESGEQPAFAHWLQQFRNQKTDGGN